MYRRNAQDYKVALPLIKGLLWWGGGICVPLEKAQICYYKGVIMTDCHTAVMLFDMIFVLITNSGSYTFSYSSSFSSNTMNKKLRTDIKIQCFQVEKNRYLHKFNLNIYHIHQYFWLFKSDKKVPVVIVIVSQYCVHKRITRKVLPGEIIY